MTEERRTPIEEVRRLYEETESRTARAMEDLVSRDSFGELLARVTENVVGVYKISSDALDLLLRNFRLAARQDVTRLARQIARTEDKLEMLLQEIEHVRERLEAEGPAASERTPADGRSRAAGRGGQGARGRAEPPS